MNTIRQSVDEWYNQYAPDFREFGDLGDTPKDGILAWQNDPGDNKKYFKHADWLKIFRK